MIKRITLLLGSIGILLRIFPVWARPTWYDENFTILLTRLPINKLLEATAGDVHPPLWYLLCWPLAHIPNIPPWVTVRIPSVLASILTVWVWWAILKVMTRSERVRLVAFGLFCFIPQQIYYAQEGRMYALLTLLVLSAWLCILQCRWIWLVVIMTCMLYLHNYGLFYLASLWLATIFYYHHWKLTTIKATLAMAGSFLLFIPWVIVLINQMNEIQGTYWMVRVSIPSILSEFVYSYFANGLITANIVNITVLVGVLVWIIIWDIRSGFINTPVYILAFVPLILAAAISYIWQPIMLYRALIPSGVFLTLILAQPLEYLELRPTIILSIFFIPALLVNLLSTVFLSKWEDNPIIRTYVSLSLVDSQWEAGDLLYYTDDGFFISGSVYWKNINNTLRTSLCGPVYGGLSYKTRSALGMESGPLPDKVTGRVWVLTAETPLTPQCENDYLETNGLLISEPLFCAQDDILVKSCVYLYLVDPQ